MANQVHVVKSRRYLYVHDLYIKNNSALTKIRVFPHKILCCFNQYNRGQHKKGSKESGCIFELNFLNTNAL